MSEQAKLYAPLTADNAALVLVDHQVGLMTGVRDYSTGELKHNVVALAKAAKALKLPIVVTTTARDSMWGPTFPELVEALPGIQIIDRSTVNAWDDPKVAAAIEATGRKKLIIAGISLEVCAAFPAITAIGKGYDAYVAVDASGTFSDTKREAGLLRMQRAGGSGRGLRRARYALGDPRRPNLQGLRQAKRGGADEPALTGKELSGNWRGWATGEQGQERATMIVTADGSYKASTTRGSTTEGKFYLQDGRQGQDRTQGGA